MLERVTAILQDMPQLMQRQCEDMVLGWIRKELQETGNRGAGGGEYVMDDNGLLWVAPLGKVPRLAVPQSRSRDYGAGAQHLWASRDGENYNLD